jgi:predicted transcriptional regulator
MNKDLLIKAVKEFDRFTKSQKALLILLIEFAKDDVVNMTVESIVAMSGFTRTSIYKSLTKLEQLKFISREKILNEKVGYIKLNTPSFEPVLEFYTKKIQYLPKKVY